MNSHGLPVLPFEPNFWGCHKKKKKKIYGSQELTLKLGGVWLWGRADERQSRLMPQIREDMGGPVCWLGSFITHTDPLPRGGSCHPFTKRTAALLTPELPPPLSPHLGPGKCNQRRES